MRAQALDVGTLVAGHIACPRWRVTGHFLLGEQFDEDTELLWRALFLKELLKF